MSTYRPIGRHAFVRLAGIGITLGLAVVIGGPALATAATSKTVAVLDASYNPTTFTIEAGTVLVFKNTSSFPHTATADNGAFDTGTISPGTSKSVVVKKVGQIPFHCQFHGAVGGVGQTGTITVTAAAAVAAAPRPTKAAGGARAPATDTPTDLPGAIEGVPLAAFTAAGVITLLLAFGLNAAGGAIRRRS